MHPIEPSRSADLAVSGGLSVASLGTGLYAVAEQVPASTGIMIASIAASVAIQLGRMFWDDHKRKLTDAVEHLRESVAAAEDREVVYTDRIKHLVTQVDAKDARMERLFGVILAHVADLPESARAEIGKAVSPGATGAPTD